MEQSIQSRSIHHGGVRVSARVCFTPLPFSRVALRFPLRLEGRAMNTPMQFPSPSDTLYELTDSASAMVLTDQLTARLAQLHAMLSATHGNAGDTFRHLCHEHQEHYMWACYMLAGETRELMTALVERQRVASA
ncbi:MAG: hypothetical protein JSS57_13055 [Proteobacteria bacterium]|nr:hypothetical protein [Pseudomonadota bacterium]